MKTAALVGSLLVSCLTGCAARDGAGTTAPLMASDVPPTPSNEDVARHLAQFVTGDERELEEIGRRLDGDVPRPWTVERLAAYAASSLDAREHADLIYLLAASKDTLGLKVAGLALDHDDLEVRMAAARGIENYWIEVKRGVSNAETMWLDAKALWESRRDRLRHIR